MGGTEGGGALLDSFIGIRYLNQEGVIDWGCIYDVDEHILLHGWVLHMAHSSPQNAENKLFSHLHFILKALLLFEKKPFYY